MDNENDNNKPENSEEDSSDALSTAVRISKSLGDNIEMIQRAFQSAYSPELFQQTNNLLQEAVSPLAEASQLASEAMRAFTPVKLLDIPEDTLRIADILSDFPQIYTPSLEFNIPDFKALQIGDSLTTVINEMQNSVSLAFESLAFESPAIKWLRSFDWASIFQPLELPSFDIEPDDFIEYFLQKMYETHWFPGAIWDTEFSLTIDVMKVIEHTRASKSRTQKIDKAIFSYYTDTMIEDIKKSWRTLGLPEYLMRLLHQSVQAYHRKEYGITVIVMATQWEGIICNKAHDYSRKAQTKTKEHFHELTNSNDYPEIFDSFFDDFILYDCRSSQDTIHDTPGRNSAAHSFYDRYPSKKAALNAILFTDFLLKLQPINNIR